MIELLVVIAVIAVLLALVAPLTGSMRKSGDLNKALTQISLSLEQARAYAVANNTYVWAGFKETQTPPTITMALVAGNSGAASDLTEERWRPIANPQRFDGVLFHDGSGVSDLATADDLAASTLSAYQLPVGGTTTQLDKVIQFTPTGAAQIKADGPSRLIQLGLKPAYGSGAEPEAANVAVMQVGGLSGQVRIFRP